MELFRRVRQELNSSSSSLGVFFSFFGAKPTITKINPTRKRIPVIHKSLPALSERIVSSVNKPQTNRLTPKTPPPTLIRVN